MNIEIVQEAFDELFAAQGVEKQVFDESSSITLAVGDFPLTVTYRESADDIALTAILGDVPYWAANDIRAFLMDANFAWRGGFGRTFAWSKELGAPVLMERLVEADLEMKTLGEKLVGFLEAAETWRGKIDDILIELDEDDELAGLGDDPAANLEDTEVNSSSSIADFLRV